MIIECPKCPAKRDVDVLINHVREQHKMTYSDLLKELLERNDYGEVKRSGE